MRRAVRVIRSGFSTAVYLSICKFTGWFFARFLIIETFKQPKKSYNVDAEIQGLIGGSSQIVGWLPLCIMSLWVELQYQKYSEEIRTSLNPQRDFENKAEKQIYLVHHEIDSLSFLPCSSWSNITKLHACPRLQGRIITVLRPHGSMLAPHWLKWNAGTYLRKH
jgi:hypothetical protein